MPAHQHLHMTSTPAQVQGKGHVCGFPVHSPRRGFTFFRGPFLMTVKGYLHLVNSRATCVRSIRFGGYFRLLLVNLESASRLVRVNFR